MGKGFELLGKEHIDTFCEALKISENEIEKVYVNPGRSANNTNFVIATQEDSYLYRIPGSGTDKFCSRANEALAYETLASLKITDEVIYLSKDTGIKISKYYENSRIPYNDNKNELFSSMQTLRRLHNLDIKFPHVDSLFDRMKRYRKFALDVGGEIYYLEGFSDYYNSMMEFEDNVKNTTIKKCFTHGDASINNFLITNEHPYPILIDMEFPAMSHPFDDIATFCVDAEYRKNDILLMTEYYLERKPSPFEQYHILGLCSVAAMMWYSWAVYKSAVEENNKLFLDFRNDYHKYVEEVYSEAIKVL